MNRISESYLHDCWDGREIIIELEKGRVAIYKKQPDAR